MPSYDWAAGRWLPVPRELVSPDGASYAYSQLVFPPVGPTPINGPGPGPIGSRVHLVDVGSAADHVILDSHTLWEAVAYSGRQIYLIHPGFEGPAPGGLWTMDPSTATVHQLVPEDGLTWAVIGADAGWATDMEGGLARLDFATTTVSTWFTVPGKMLRPIGLNLNGLPIVEGEANFSIAGSYRGGAWLVKGPQQAQQLAPDTTMVDDAVSDAHGIWLLSFQNIYLWTSDGQLTQIGSPAGQGDLGLGGPCQ